MAYSFEFKPYSRKFSKPLSTAYGLWTERKGILLRFEKDFFNGKSGPDETWVAYGEIAPIPHFQTETFDDALSFCKSVPKSLDEAFFKTIPSELPCCQSGFATPWLYENKHASPHTPFTRRTPSPITDDLYKFKNAYLFPSLDSLSSWLSSSTSRLFSKIPISHPPDSNEPKLNLLSSILQAGFTTFKCKIGLDLPEKEISLVELILDQLMRIAISKNSLNEFSNHPLVLQLRLDANGSLSLNQAKKWLHFLDRHSNIDFFEQPLGPDQEKTLFGLAQDYKTRIALHESVTKLEHLYHFSDNNWPGFFIVSPLLLGNPEKFLVWLKQDIQRSKESSIIYASSLETVFGLKNALKILAQDSRKLKDIGFGTSHLFLDNLSWEPSQALPFDSVFIRQPQTKSLNTIWKTL